MEGIGSIRSKSFYGDMLILEGEPSGPGHISILSLSDDLGEYFSS